MGENEVLAEEQVSLSTEEESGVLIWPLKFPLVIDGVAHNKIKMNFGKLTGADILKIDNELRMEKSAFDNLLNLRVTTKLIAYASGINEHELARINPVDFTLMQFATRNFFMQW